MPTRAFIPESVCLIHPDPAVRERCLEALERARISVNLFASTAELPATMPDAAERKTLTRREQQVLDAVMAGKSNRESAVELGISVKTIELHRANLMGKLGARNLVDLARLVIESR